MAKLNQVVAAEKGIKQAVARDVTDVYQQLQKSAALTGISRTYRPKDEEGERKPAEYTKVQYTVAQAMVTVSERLTALFDVTATKETANCKAVADVTVDGKKILESVPIGYLLFLEKQLNDIHTVVRKLPVLDPSETWGYDENQECYITDPTETVSTKKIPRNHVVAAATKEHAEQVQVFTEDVIAGYWTTVKLSGALPGARVTALTRKVENLIAAVKSAREEANGIDAPPVHCGKKVFDYLFG